MVNFKLTIDEQLPLDGSQAHDPKARGCPMSRPHAEKMLVISSK
jgi:hypothetical protein